MVSRRPEELAFEITSQQAIGVPTRKARLLVETRRAVHIRTASELITGDESGAARQ